MRRILGTLVALVVAVSLVLIPATVSADLGKCTGWDKVKWENNQNSWKIYLQHWGRTPTSAMSRLAGLLGQMYFIPAFATSPNVRSPLAVTSINAWVAAATATHRLEHSDLPAPLLRTL